MSESKDRCTTCYGTGELVTEEGAAACPDCFGEGRRMGGAAETDWRLRELERLYAGDEREHTADVKWLLHEVRRGREALVRILTLCHDADERDELAREVKYQANEALRMYEPQNE